MARGEAGVAPLVEVVFETDEPDPEVEVLLDVDFLLFPAWPEVDHLVLRPAPDGRRRLVVLLPEDVELSYRFARRRRGGTVGRTPDDLLHLRETAVADPAAPERISGAFGSVAPASVRRLPRAPQHPVWRTDGAPGVAAGFVRAPWCRRTVDLGDREVLLLVPPGPTHRVAVLLDGEVWRHGLGLPDVIDRWSVEHTALALVPTPDRGDLADPGATAHLILDRVLAALRGELGAPATSRDRVAVVGQSYGGLAAATLAVDHPETIGTAVVGSGSFWFRADTDPREIDTATPGDLVRRLAGRDLTGTRFFLHVGLQEGDMLAQSRGFHAAALACGADSRLRTWPGGHDYAWYRHAVLQDLEDWCR